MRNVRDQVLKYAIERTRREKNALSATWQSPDKTSAATIKARRMRDWSEQGGAITPMVGYIRLGNAARSAGSLSRCPRDSQPPSEVLTELHFPNPQPGRPKPGASPAEILAWNLKVLADDPR